jgi:hypothetical protein
MKCTTCDETLAPGVMFCPNCGARVPAPSSAGAPTTAVPASYAGSASSAPPYTPQPAATPYSPSNATPYSPPQTYQPAQQSYQAGQPYMPVALPTSSAATVSLVFGILAWVILPFIGSIVAVIAGHMARNEIRASGGQLQGAGYATAGLVLGYIQIVLSVLACLGIMFLAMIGAAVE